MLDEKLISIIVCETNEQLCKGLLNELQKLNIPEEMQVDVQIIRASRGDLAAAYNTGMKQSNAKYRLFIDESARNLDKDLINEVVNLLYLPKVGMVGLFGSEMPLDGNFTNSKKRFGMYVQHEPSDSSQGSVTLGENPLWTQNVHCVDGRFVAVSQDIEWDEAVGDDFATAAFCTRYRKDGYRCIVPLQDKPWMTFEKPSFYSTQRNLNFIIGAKNFSERYLETIQPLVSILIPTYNQPSFFEKALLSALQQEYKNLEIVVGDDSTNDDTEKLLKEKYLDKYPQIRYFHHEKPLGGHGLKNIEFILDHAEGEYISFLFHDDIYYPAKISRMMTCYEEDLKEQLGIVTSARNVIDENDKILGRFNPWQPVQDTVLSGEQLAEGIFSRMSNLVGELTTVLLRKKFLKQERGEHKYRVSVYCGILDTELADVSTFLEICRTGHSCMFLKDTLSAFRMHEGQNSGKLGVVLGALMEWLDYLVLSWLNGAYIHSKETLEWYFSLWYPWAVREFNRAVKLHEGEVMPETYVWCCAVFEEMGKMDYEKVIDLSVAYMMKRAEDTSVLERICHKNERGLWCKR
ncbi:MAG: glycosyltransferase [Schwartzia sp.]|nr:glycosyltransferase [Schwartzia sp. (in: firmicutes)]